MVTDRQRATANLPKGLRRFLSDALYTYVCAPAARRVMPEAQHTPQSAMNEINLLYEHDYTVWASQPYARARRASAVFTKLSD